jgi:DNA-directed RNA polymerase specialized sigma24 family protein
VSGDDHSITRWYVALKAGDRDGAGRLWDLYFTRMARLARATLRPGVPGRAVADEEDAALDAFASFCVGAEHGRFSGINGREDLWRLLTIITVRKARAQLRRQRRQKRGGCLVVPEADLDHRAGGLDGIAARHLGPDLAALATEELGRLLDRLGDETLRHVAVWRMDGLTCVEIAARLGCARRTVARQLDLIRKLWSHEDRPDPR